MRLTLRFTDISAGCPLYFVARGRACASCASANGRVQLQAGTLNTRPIVGTWFTASRTTRPAKLLAARRGEIQVGERVAPAKEIRGDDGEREKERREREREKKQERGRSGGIRCAQNQTESGSLTGNRRCIRNSCRETVVSNQSEVYLSNFYLSPLHTRVYTCRPYSHFRRRIHSSRRVPRALSEINETLSQFKASLGTVERTTYRNYRWLRARARHCPSRCDRARAIDKDSINGTRLDLSWNYFCENFRKSSGARSVSIIHARGKNQRDEQSYPSVAIISTDIDRRFN